jgi:hypothetical protein
LVSWTLLLTSTQPTIEKTKQSNSSAVSTKVQKNTMLKQVLFGTVLLTTLQLHLAFVVLQSPVQVATSLHMQQGQHEGPGRQRSAILTAAVTALVAPLAAMADDPPTTLHIVDYPKQGSCGQADVPPAGVFFAKNLGGMVDGPCSREGYTVPQGTENGIKEKDKQREYQIYGKE